MRLAALVGAFCGQVSAAQLPSVELVPVTEGRRIIDIGHFGDGSDRLLLAATEGRIFVLENGVESSEPVLDIRDRSLCCGEQGFASFAIHPDFPATPDIFVLYSARVGAIGGAPDDVLSRFTWSAALGRFDESTEEEILRIPQPDPTHNGNDLEFGPDGYLYLSTGDGGGFGDPFLNGQDLASLNGKILRIDPDGGTPYAVPATNPYVDEVGALDEIWASGLRNPWRMSFDQMTGDLWIADAGEDLWEEINRIPAGSAGLNFGWNQTQGLECFIPGCALDSFDPPTFVYCHPEVDGCPFLDDCSAVGARVYRGTRSPALWGWVIALDFCSGRIRGLRPTEGGWEPVVLYDSDEFLITLGEDERGELYVSTTSNNTYRIQGPAAPTIAVPSLGTYGRVALILMLSVVALRRLLG